MSKNLNFTMPEKFVQAGTSITFTLIPRTWRSALVLSLFLRLLLLPLFLGVGWRSVSRIGSRSRLRLDLREDDLDRGLCKKSRFQFETHLRVCANKRQASTRHERCGCRGSREEFKSFWTIRTAYMNKRIFIRDSPNLPVTQGILHASSQ